MTVKHYEMAYRNCEILRYITHLLAMRLWATVCLRLFLMRLFLRRLLLRRFILRRFLLRNPSDARG